MLAGELSLPTVTYNPGDIAQAHDDMELDRVVGKQVVLTRDGTAADVTVAPRVR